MPRALVASMMALLVAVSGCGRPATPEASESPTATGTAESEPESSQPEASGDVVRYLSLGDSLTQGVGAPDEQTASFPALLAEKWRGEGCEVELQNAGISGQCPARSPHNSCSRASRPHDVR